MTASPLSLEHVVVLFGALQSVLLAVALWAKTTERRAPNRLLSALLACCAVLLVEYCVVDTQVFRSLPDLLLLGAPALFAIGPLYYQYTRTLLRSTYRRSDLVHFVPAALVAAALLPVFLQDDAAKVESDPRLLQANRRRFGRDPRPSLGRRRLQATGDGPAVIGGRSGPQEETAGSLSRPGRRARLPCRLKRY